MLAEIGCLAFYYPFDLMKTRMQVNDVNYNYNGTLDAAIKIFNEGLKTENPTIFQYLYQIKRFYKGMFMYTVSYSLFIGIEFSLFEMIFAYLERIRKQGILEIPVDKHHHGSSETL